MDQTGENWPELPYDAFGAPDDQPTIDDQNGTPEESYIQPESDAPDTDGGYPDTGIIPDEPAPSEGWGGVSHVDDILTHRETPAFINYDDHISYGDTSNLPDASILRGLDWYGNAVRRNDTVIPVPDHPECVVRIQYVSEYNPLQVYGDMVRDGIRHFEILADSGIAIPAQRFVVAPEVRPDEPQIDKLYAITEFIDGKPLSAVPQHATYAQTIIDGLAKYHLQVFNNPGETRFFWDKSTPKQHTLQPDHTTVMHDAGLDFAPIERGTAPSKTWFEFSAEALTKWATKQHIDPPDGLQELNHLIEHQYRRHRDSD